MWQLTPPLYCDTYIEYSALPSHTATGKQVRHLIKKPFGYHFLCRFYSDVHEWSGVCWSFLNEYCKLMCKLAIPCTAPPDLLFFLKKSVDRTQDNLVPQPHLFTVWDLAVNNISIAWVWDTTQDWTGVVSACSMVCTSQQRNTRYLKAEPGI